MTFYYPDNRTYLQILASEVLKCGRIPEHVAFIMDGNRRYAKELGVPTSQGHAAGGEKMKDVFQWCWHLGVKEVTLYLFSIENFKRTKEEVKATFDVILGMFKGVIWEFKSGNHNDGRYQFVGNWDKIPARLKPLASAVMMQNRGGKGPIVNIAFAYSSQVEMLQGVQRLEAGLTSKILNIDDITPQLLDEAMRYESPRPVDLLIRTSGDTRLSDFLTWQASHAFISFVKTPWPAFSCWSFLHSVAQWQASLSYLVVVPQKEKLNQRQREFLEQMRSVWYAEVREEYEFGCEIHGSMLYEMKRNNEIKEW